jgi:hypothetical protein
VVALTGKQRRVRPQEGSADMHGVNGSIEGALTSVPYETLCPGKANVPELMEAYR